MLPSHSRRAALAALATISLASVGAGVASATTPPTEPADTTPTTETTTGGSTMTAGSISETTMAGAPTTAGAPTESTGPTGPLCAAAEGMSGDTMSDHTMSTEPAATGATSPMDTTVATMDTTMVTPAGDGGSTAESAVGTAVSMNPLLTDLAAAIDAAGLTETLDGEGPFTVLAPVDSAFAKLDPAQLEAAMADPSGLLAAVVSYHVIPEQLSSTDLASGGSFQSVLGEELTFEMREETLVVNDGEAAVQCMDLPAGNGTVFLIDTVLMPPSLGSEAGGAATETTTAGTTGETTVGTPAGTPAGTTGDSAPGTTGGTIVGSVPSETTEATDMGATTTPTTGA